MIKGDFPAIVIPSADMVWLMLFSEAMAIKLGLDRGESYCFCPSKMGGINKPHPIPVHIAGIWQAEDRDDPAWFYTQFPG